VYDVLSGEVAGGGDDGVSGGAGSLFCDEAFALLEELGACGVVDGAVDTSAAQERAVGGIDDGLGVLSGDIALGELDGVGHVVVLFQGVRCGKQVRNSLVCKGIGSLVFWGGARRRCSVGVGSEAKSGKKC